MHVISTLARRLFTALGVARDAMGRHAYANHVIAPLMGLVWIRMTRLLSRFDRLMLRWERGQLPTPRGPRPPAARKPAARPADAPRLPNGQAWLLKLVPPAGAATCLFEVLLHEAELRALVAAAPQAGRILRPLARMFGVPLPDFLRLPPRPRKPRPPAAPKPPRRRLTPLHLTRARIAQMTAAELTHLYGRLPPHFPLPIPNLAAIRRKIAQG